LTPESSIVALSFHPLTVAQRTEETQDSVSIALAVPPELRDAFRFRAGQFLTLKAQIDGREERRSYSICVSQDAYEAHGHLRVGIKRVAGGRFSNWANEHLLPGQMIEVMTPDGRFTTATNAQRAQHYVGFAGGSGITPMMSLIGTVLADEPRSHFTLIYGNRSMRSIMFLEQLEGLKNRYLGRLRLYHVLSDDHQEVELFNGLLDQAKCTAFLEQLVPASTIDEAFICGPEPMMNAAEAALLEGGVPRERIRIERFGVPLPSGAPKAVAPVAPSGSDYEVILLADGKSRKLKVPAQGVSILDAGLAAGVDLPYACKGGVCCTCRAKVIEGEVVMDKNYTLEPAEVAAGFVLTCQCHPRSERVVLSYDERL
jgi:ring-1,2-phenylacetyl-CoA epoxidase subunit PaaE